MPEHHSGGSPEFPEKVSAQHGHLSAMIGGLRRAHDDGQSWEALAEYLDRLLADVRHHFIAEEAVMEAAGYTRLEEHRNEHEIFMRRLEVVRVECERKETDLMPLLTEMLDNWFKRHEETWDRDAASSFLKME